MNKRSVRNLLLIFVLFALPILLAFFFFFSNIKLPFGTVNRGLLLHPVVEVNQLLNERQMVAGNNNSFHKIIGKWQIIYITEGHIDNKDLQQLKLLKNLRLSLGKNYSRVGLVFVLGRAKEQDSDVALFSKNKKLFDYVSLFFLPLQSTTHLLAQAKLDDRGIFLMDPQGNIILAYKFNVQPNDIYKDLERLLRYSKIG